MSSTIIVLAVIVVLVLWAVTVYNGLVKLSFEWLSRGLSGRCKSKTDK